MFAAANLLWQSVLKKLYYWQCICYAFPNQEESQNFFKYLPSILAACDVTSTVQWTLSQQNLASNCCPPNLLQWARFIETDLGDYTEKLPAVEWGHRLKGGSKVPEPCKIGRWSHQVSQTQQPNLFKFSTLLLCQHTVITEISPQVLDSVLPYIKCLYHNWYQIQALL